MARSQGRQMLNYIDGNTARQLDVRRAIEEEPRRRLSNETRKNREKAYHMNFGYVVFLAAALFIAGYVLIGYIQMQADLTSQMQTIASLESELNSLRLANDEELIRINSSLDLEEIKRIAIGELGMVYATEGQIINYTNQAKAGLFHPLIGRETEMEQLIRTLLRTTRNNPAVIGHAGIGKTALIQGLIQFMTTDEAPDYLHAKEVVGIDIAHIMLDSPDETAYAETVKQVIQLVLDANGQKILYLKDVSLLVQTQANPENKEPAKFLKLALLEGRLNCILETDRQNYVQHLESDTAVLRMLGTLFLEEPSVPESIKNISALKENLENHYGVSIPNETVRQACFLANRYLKQQYFPYSLSTEIFSLRASIFVFTI